MREFVNINIIRFIYCVFIYLFIFNHVRCEGKQMTNHKRKEMHSVNNDINRQSVALQSFYSHDDDGVDCISLSLAL